MEMPITAELAWAMHQSRRATLRYNPRGFGASQGTRGSAADRLEDARAALHSLRQSLEIRDDEPVAVVGIQDGGIAAIELAHASPGVGALVLVSPPDVLRDPLLSFAGPPALLVFPEGASWTWNTSAGTVRLEEIAGTDARFVRGLPMFGRAVTRFLDGLTGAG